MSNLSMLEMHIVRLWSIARGSPVMFGLGKTALELSNIGRVHGRTAVINVSDIRNSSVSEALRLQGIEKITIIQEYYQPLINTPERMALLLKRLASGVKEGNRYSCFRLLDFDSGFKVERSGSEVTVSRASPF
jgi:hypothetical protein